MAVTMVESARRTSILLVEDDFKLAALVKEYLEQQEFDVEVVSSGSRANAVIRDSQPDLVILDIMLPGKDGLAVCRDARPDFTGPILMLTARAEDLDEVVGLEVGADDYLKKPVRPRVLLARIRTLLRRIGAPGAVPSSRRIELGSLVVDASQRMAIRDGSAVDLTTAEFDLLWLLALYAGEPLSRDRIYRELRGIEHDGIDRSIDLRISRLRSKLGDKDASLIKSVRGVGYQLVRG